MLNQIDLYIDRADLSGLWSDLAVKIHGFIMSRLPTDYAAELHNGKLQPFSIFCYYGDDYGIVRISTLNDSAKQIIDAVSDIKRIRVFGMSENIRVIKIDPALELDFRDLISRLHARKYQLQILSPAMYRSEGKLHSDPNFPAYFESVIQKLDVFEGITYTRDQINSAFKSANIGKYYLESDTFVSGSKRFSGMTGKINITLPEKPEEAEILKTVLAYASYSGIGGMTTQGMGGVALQILNKKETENE